MGFLQGLYCGLRVGISEEVRPFVLTFPPENVGKHPHQALCKSSADVG